MQLWRGKNPKVLEGWREKWKRMSLKAGTGREEVGAETTKRFPGGKVGE